MDFIVTTPKKIKSTVEKIEKIRVSFLKLKNNIPKYSLIIRIGKKIADQVGIKPGDKISFSYNPQNNKIWLLKKSTDNVGFTLGKQNESSFTLQLTWNIFKPEDKDLSSIRDVKHDIYDEGIRIYYS